MTGYDWCAHVQGWLKDNSHEGLSVCEAILVDEKFAHLPEHVSVARVFHSHVQVEGWIGLAGTCALFRGCFWKVETKLPLEPERYTWFDYVSLQQAAPSNFEPTPSPS